MNSSSNIPTHVSIIMDGNGRWAKEKGKERVYGHAAGVESVRACVEAAAESGVKYLSLFAFSEENWGRPDSEVSGLMSLMMQAIQKEIPSLKEKGVKFKVLGNLERLSPELRSAISKAEADTEPAEGKVPLLTLIIFLSYSGKWDILQAAKKMALEYSGNPEKLESLGVDDFDRFLVTYGIPDPDLVIRTSGEKRISNYLLWQGAYSEFYSADALWPDFGKENFRLALEEYGKRDRRYGKVK
ncbi:MAG: polyprenyl diphosphate synthase [Bacteroidales bacterium]|nr:polyprenyl diphosphate synthase [Bacteroidales bacterium]MDY6001566.1 polyprenyl diphosphate synthase [Candidatus Cryptobacteroides sp.]